MTKYSSSRSSEVSDPSMRQSWVSLERVTVVSPDKGSEMALSSSQSPLQGNNVRRKTQQSSALDQSHCKSRQASTPISRLETIRFQNRSSRYQGNTTEVCGCHRSSLRRKYVARHRALVPELRITRDQPCTHARGFVNNTAFGRRRYFETSAFARTA